LRTILVRRGQEHALAGFATHGSRGEVFHHDDRLAEELLRLVIGTNARDDLPLLAAQVDLEKQQLVGVRAGPGDADTNCRFSRNLRT
jgi:hypothetical protein